MKFFKSKFAAFLTDMICSMLLGASVCSILLPSAGLSVGYGDCLLLMLADLALIYLFTRKWWLFPVFAVSAVAIALIVTTALDLNEETWAYLDGFLRWCIASYPNTAPYSFNGSIIAVQLVLALPAAILTYLYYRRLFFFPILPPIALGLLLWIHFTDKEVFWPALVMLLVVIFLSMAKMTGNRINRSLPEKERISSALLVITAIILVPIIVFLAFFIGPKNDGDWRSKGLVNAVEDFSTFLGWGKGDGPTQGTFDIEDSGFSPLEKQLGGNIDPDNTTVMQIKTDTPVRLTGAVFDTYDGHKWYDTGVLDRYRFTGFVWQGLRRQVYGLDKPHGDNRAKELFTNMTLPVKLEISYSQRGRTLFYTGQVQTLESGSMDVTDVFFNNQSELFTSKSVQPIRYTLQTVVFNTKADDFDENMKSLEALTADVPDKVFDALQTRYLQIPDTLPDSVYQMAKEMTQDCNTPYEKAEAIEAWLQKNCTYTLSPGDPPPDQDFVEHFLEKREGYCVYYASAMTVLSRCAGLPARFVTGYALKSDPSSNANDAFIATHATAHAWTEVYFKGIGWLTFDATGWNFNEDAVVEQIELQSTGSFAVPTPAPLPDMVLDGSLQTHASGMSDEVKVMLISLMCVAVAVGLFAVVRIILLIKGASGYYRRLCRQYDTSSKRLDACYRKVVRQLSFLEVKQETSDTISSFAARADRYLGSKEMSDLCDSVIRMRFGLEEPIESEIIAFCTFSAELEKRLRADLGISGYFWHRILIGR